MLIIAGRNNVDLAQEVAKYLNCEVMLPKITKFNDGEMHVTITDSLKSKTAIIFKSTCKPANDNLMELLLLCDAAKNVGAAAIKAVIPYFGYARQDQHSDNSSLASRLVSKMLRTVGLKEIITVELHSKRVENFLGSIVRNLDPFTLFIEKLKPSPDVIFVSPDVGGIPRAQRVAAQVGSKIAVIAKNRVDNEVISSLVGEVAGKHCILVDDIIDSGRTLVSAIDLLKDRGALSVSAWVAHICSTETLELASLYALYFTDTNQKIKKATCISVAELIANTLFLGAK